MRRLLPLLAVPVLVLAGCSAPEGDDGTIDIVASTSVYGDIAAAVAGDAAEVTSIITSPTQDPHSYEVTARDRLAIETADLVVFNGGGYDGFITVVLAAMDDAPDAIEAAAVAGFEGDDHAHDEEDHAHDEDGHDDHGHLEGVNEHVWYDLHVMEAVAEEIAEHLAELDPANADTFAANAAAFIEGLEEIESRLESLRSRAEGLGAVISEPVPGYLLAEAGLVDVTPEGFSEAIEEGTDVAPALLASVLATIAAGDAVIVANNPQTGGPETERVLDAAAEAGVPVVDFTETLPEGTSYLEWMEQNVAALAAALP
jgi:zinc/manganese transport system substrate-binding protein